MVNVIYNLLPFASVWRVGRDEYRVKALVIRFMDIDKKGLTQWPGSDSLTCWKPKGGASMVDYLMRSVSLQPKIMISLSLEEVTQMPFHTALSPKHPNTIETHKTVDIMRSIVIQEVAWNEK